MTRCRYGLLTGKRCRRTGTWPTLAFLIAIVVWGLTSGEAAFAQLFSRPTALQGARVVTMDGTTLEEGTVVIAGSQIRAVEPGVHAPLLAKTIDAHGTTITPGLIDAYSLLGRGEKQGPGVASATRRAEEAFDRYDTLTIVEALQQGVTAVYLSPQGPAGLCGMGAMIRLVRDADGGGAYGKVLKSPSALCVDLTSSGSSVTRLKILEGVRKAFRDAIEYRRSREGYQEDVAEYTKKLEVEASQKASTKKPDPAPKASDANASGQQSSEAKPAAKPDEGAKTQKPRRPPRDPQSELILRALDREIPVRVAAHYSSDILNALELAEEFSLDLILEGATESYLVAEEIATARAAVVLAQMDLPGIPGNDVYRRATLYPGKRLDSAHVPWVVGSGPASSDRTRFLAFNAQLATASAPSREPLRVITADAAKFLRVEQQIGRIRPGMLADLVVWSGDPLEPATKVLRVFVDGQQVYSSVD